MEDQAWLRQSQSLVEVQKQGSGLEERVQQLLGWDKGRIAYDATRKYSIEVDSVYPSSKSPETMVSVTYTDPDKPGHSNENKLHLKVGELALLKYRFPELRCVLAIGGTAQTWLPYVLAAFKVFYDEVVFLWEEKGRQRLKEIKEKPHSVPLGHRQLWENLQKEWAYRNLSSVNRVPPCGLVRYQILEILKAEPRVHHPNYIRNEIARLCMQRSRDSEGSEWNSYLRGLWNNIEMSRNYFNPVEAAVEISLTAAELKFSGGVSRDVPVQSLLHDFGMVGTRLSEDFILHSDQLNKPVYIQCKSSGGGRRQHGKNIQNRTKEQITRSILYSCRSTKPGIVEWHPKHFHWIAIIDGDWGVTRTQPLKYIHMLELAGYDKIIGAYELLNGQSEVKRKGNPLIEYLVQTLGCRKQ